jgi:uroporphyrinogen-III synthase
MWTLPGSPPLRMAQLGLEGLVVGIPAARRATETARLVQRWGGIPLVGPTVQEVPVEDEEPLLQATEEVIASNLRWSVLLTGVGTRRWLSRAESWGRLEDLLDRLRSADLIPRGAKAKAALAAHGLESAWVPEGETSREIATWLTERLQPGDVLALQRQGEPVPALRKPLEGAGARVIEVAPYRWELPDDRGPAMRLMLALTRADVHALVITSAPQIHHLFALARQGGVEADLRRALGERVFLAAVGTVAGAGLEAEGLVPDLVAQPPRMGALIRALASARDRVLEKSGVGATGSSAGTQT